MPYFSIVIPVYNKEKFVAKTLKSVLGQTFTDFEIILINDGSTDESEARIFEFDDPRIQYFSKKNEGVAIARNFGIKKASANYICFLDADDFWYPNFLETMHAFSIKFNDYKVFSSAIEIETKKNIFVPKYSITQLMDFVFIDFFEASQQECALWTSSICIHKSVFEKVGTFDTNIKHGEDTELWIRIGLEFPIVFIWKILARYVYDDKSISRNSSYFFEPYTFEKYALDEKKNPALKKYMDLNRFSAVVKCNVRGDKKLSKKIYSEIDLKNLSLKKRILLHLPSFALKQLISFQRFLTHIGLGTSVFR